MTPDHRFRPLLGDPQHCQKCGKTRRTLCHFGDHAGPVVPVSGFTCTLVVRVAERNAP